MKADNGRVYARAGRVVSRRVAGEIVLVPLTQRTGDAVRRTADLFVLNKTGEHLWELLNSPRSAEDLARNLSETFEVSAGEAASDVSSFLASLIEIGALTESEKT